LCNGVFESHHRVGGRGFKDLLQQITIGLGLPINPTSEQPVVLLVSKLAVTHAHWQNYDMRAVMHETYLEHLVDIDFLLLADILDLCQRHLVVQSYTVVFALLVLPIKDAHRA
jgi:hypothetical protein